MMSSTDPRQLFKSACVGVASLWVFSIVPLISALYWAHILIVMLALLLPLLFTILARRGALVADPTTLFDGTYRFGGTKPFNGTKPFDGTELFSVDRLKYVHRGAVLVLLFAALVSFYWRGKPWLTGDNLVASLVIILALKLAESRTRRDLNIVIYGALVLMVMSSRYLSGIAVVVYLLCGMLLFIVALHGLQSQKKISLTSSRIALKLFVFAIPVACMLFVTFPRLQGPLWDLGIVIGLPISMVVDQSDREKGIKATLKAGQVSRLKKDDAPVLVAEFKSTVPYKSRLYWRGPVFSFYDGVEWTLDDDWDNRARLLKGAFKGDDSIEQVLVAKSELVSYEARVSADNNRYLYALDMPVGQSTESFISEDFQLLGIRKLFTEFNYGQQAYLEYSGGRPLTQGLRASYLQIPADSNPRLVAWGNALQTTYGSVEARIHQLRVHLADGGYSLTETPDISSDKDSLDVFFFDRKEGGIEHLASAVAIVLRAADVPTRLVSGYRGASLIALTNFVIVRQANAHVWVEAWSDDSGWSRIEAEDFVSPPVLEPANSPASKNVPEKASVAKAATTKAASAAAPDQTLASEKQGGGKPKASRQDAGFGWLATLGSGIETWIFNYNPDRQIELMQQSGLSKIDWKSLMALAVLGLLFLFAVYGVLINVRHKKQGPVEAAFEKLNRLMSKRDLHCLPQECPKQWLKRMQEREPLLYPMLETVIQQYINIRYRREVSRSQIKEFNRDIKRLSGIL